MNYDNKLIDIRVNYNTAIMSHLVIAVWYKRTQADQKLRVTYITLDYIFLAYKIYVYPTNMLVPRLSANNEIYILLRLCDE